jgi:hypothetical protein
VAAQFVAWKYEKPAHGGGPKTLLLTIGGILITGNWQGELGEHYLAWAPMPKRDKQKEREVIDAIRAKREAAKKAAA